MYLISLDTEQKQKIELNLFNFMILLYLNRTVLPVLKYPFLLLYLGLVLYLITTYRIRIFSVLKEFFHDFILIIALFTLMLISFIFSHKIYLSIFKDLTNGVLLLSIFFMLRVIVRGKKEFDFFINNLVRLIVLFGLIISILRLLELFEVYSSNPFKTVNEIAHVPDDSPMVDSNFALLPSFFGIFSLIYLLPRSDSKYARYFNLSYLFFFLNILLSGSRRGLVLLIVIIAIIILGNLLKKRSSFFFRFSNKTGPLIISFFSIIVILALYFFTANYKIKNHSFELLGSKNIVKAKYTITLNLYRYVTVFDKDLKYIDFYNRIWDVRFYPEDPDSGWGTRFHKTIYPITGMNSEIIPKEAKGYMMDSTCDGSYYDGNDLCESYTLAASINAKKGEKYRVSVYCYVSDSAVIDIACLTVLHSLIFSSNVTGTTAFNYDLNHKGTWQELKIDIISNFEGNIPVYMSFWKQGVKNFRKINGYVIFAFPLHEHVNSTQGAIIHLNYENVAKQFSSKAGYLTDKEFVHNVTNIEELKNLINRNKERGYLAFMDIPFWIRKLQGSEKTDPDPFRNFVSKFISEDTTYLPYKTALALGRKSNPFIGDRLDRWKFALKIFKNEYSFTQKIFGGGFSFLNWFGYYFYGSRTRNDYPHNPFLSVLLYSGLIGLAIYLVFMYNVIYLYIRYLDKYNIFFTFFLITFFFSFFSAGSPFDPPLMGFYVIFPFLIHSMHKKLVS